MENNESINLKIHLIENDIKNLKQEKKAFILDAAKSYNRKIAEKNKEKHKLYMKIYYKENIQKKYQKDFTQTEAYKMFGKRLRDLNNDEKKQYFAARQQEKRKQDKEK